MAIWMVSLELRSMVQWSFWTGRHVDSHIATSTRYIPRHLLQGHAASEGCQHTMSKPIPRTILVRH